MMTQNENTGILGVSLVDSQFRFVEGVKKSADEFQVTQVAHGRSREPFNYDVFLDKSMPRRFAEDITRLYRTQSFNFDRVAFSLDSTMVMVKKLSLDSQLKQEFWRNHVTWEVEQFAISPAEEYVIDFEALASEKNGDVANVLVVVVRKK